MPIYRWEGIDLAGDLHNGKSHARSVKDLEQQLFGKEWGLVHSVQVIPKSFVKPINREMRAEFYKQLSVLLDAGIFIDQALHLVFHQLRHDQFRIIINDIVQDIQQGASLSNAMQHYPMYFNSLSIRLVGAGQASGQLPSALGELADHEYTMLAFYKKLRTALMVPCVTFLFFMLITLVIFLFVVPRFATLFLSINQDLPVITTFILNISDFVRSASMFYGSMGITLGACIGYYSLWRTRLQSMRNLFIIKTPILGPLVVHSTLAYFFQSLALLAKGGVRVVPALDIAAQALDNSVCSDAIEFIIGQVKEGHDLSKAFGMRPELFSDDINALLAIAQESGAVIVMMEKISLMYKNRVEKTLSLITTIIQPSLMIVLGLLITFLIFAVYLPIFNLSYAIS